MSARIATFLAVFAAFGGSGCRLTTEPAIDPSLLPLFRTTATHYDVQRPVPNQFETLIDVVFTNHSSRDASFVNCNGGTQVVLQRQEGDGWRNVWSPVLNTCLSAPITVAPGSSYTMQVRVRGGAQGCNCAPTFADTNLTGTFRLVWGELVYDYRPSLPFGDPLPPDYRASNSFTLTLLPQ